MALRSLKRHIPDKLRRRSCRTARTLIWYQLGTEFAQAGCTRAGMLRTTVSLTGTRDGSGRERLTTSHGPDERGPYPVWSPEGASLAYQRGHGPTIKTAA